MKTLEQQPEQALQPRHFLEAENVWLETKSNIMAYGVVVKETMAQSEDDKVELIVRISDDEDDDVDFESRFFKAGDIYQMSGQDCPRCGNALYIEHHKNIDYPYYCPHCQENFYQVEIEDSWTPAVGESYFFAEFSQDDFSFTPTEEIQGIEDNNEYDFPIFRTVDECRTFCNKLNEAVRSVKP